jgi:hypothetical protein
VAAFSEPSGSDTELQTRFLRVCFFSRVKEILEHPESNTGASIEKRISGYFFV